MKSSFGNHIKYTLFGESHSHAIGITIQGLPPGFTINLGEIIEQLKLRQGNPIYNTARQEAPTFDIISGYFNNQTTGTPLTVLFYNQKQKSNDYQHLVFQPRPGHADFVAQHKYHGAQDYRGGGHFSGRLTTPLVFLGNICKQLLHQTYPKLKVKSYITQIAQEKLLSYYPLRQQIVQQWLNEQQMSDNEFMLQLDKTQFLKLQEQIKKLEKEIDTIQDNQIFLDTHGEEVFKKRLETAKKLKTSLGGKIETVIISPPAGLGEPYFHSFESVCSSLLFSLGSVQAVEFGLGENFASFHGHEVKDEILTLDNHGIKTLYNFNGGINGGITNGEHIVYQTTFKPIASIMQKQYTWNQQSKKINPLSIDGRHDTTILNRVIPVINALTYVTLYDFILQNNNNT